MKKILLLAFLFLMGCTSEELSQPTVDINNQTILVDLAQTPAEQQQGLMHIKELPKDKGMLFMFKNQRPRSFWMKNTLIPLDAFFIDNNFIIVDVIPLYPCTQDPCQAYTSQPSMYVLEVNQGEYDFKKGDAVIINIMEDISKV